MTDIEKLNKIKELVKEKEREWGLLDRSNPIFKLFRDIRDIIEPEKKNSRARGRAKILKRFGIKEHD